MKNVLIRGIGLLFLHSMLYSAELFNNQHPGKIEENPEKAFFAAVKLLKEGNPIPNDCDRESMEPMSDDSSLFKKDKKGRLMALVNGDKNQIVTLKRLNQSSLHERRKLFKSLGNEAKNTIDRAK